MSGRRSQFSFLGKQSSRFVNQPFRLHVGPLHSMHLSQKKMTSSHFLPSLRLQLRRNCCSLHEAAAAANPSRFKRIRCLMATVDEEGRLWADFALKYTRPADALDPGAGGGDATAAVSLMQGRAPYIKQTCHLPVGVAAERRWVPPRGSLTSSRRSDIISTGLSPSIARLPSSPLFLKIMTTQSNVRPPCSK